MCTNCPHEESSSSKAPAEAHDAPHEALPSWSEIEAQHQHDDFVSLMEMYHFGESLESVTEGLALMLAGLKSFTAGAENLGVFMHKMEELAHQEAVKEGSLAFQRMHYTEDPAELAIRKEMSLAFQRMNPLEEFAHQENCKEEACAFQQVSEEERVFHENERGVRDVRD